MRMLGLIGVDREISHWLERGTEHSLQWCGNLSLVDAFYTMRPTIIRNGQYLLAVDRAFTSRVMPSISF